MCVCLGKTESKENVCKCTHARIYQTKEYVNNVGHPVREWECRNNPSCQKTWAIEYDMTLDQIVGLE